MEYAQRAGEAGDDVDMGDGGHRTSIAEYWKGGIRARVRRVGCKHICEMRVCKNLLVCRAEMTPQVMKEDTLSTRCTDECLQFGVICKIPSGQTDHGYFPVYVILAYV